MELKEKRISNFDKSLRIKLTETNNKMRVEQIEMIISTLHSMYLELSNEIKTTQKYNLNHIKIKLLEYTELLHNTIKQIIIQDNEIQEKSK